jgi:phage tail sheath gpL-like
MSGSNVNTIAIPGFNFNERVPGVFAVVDASQANTAQVNQVALLIGQMLPGGTATPGQVVPSAGIGDAQASFGAGSILAIQVERYRNLDPTGSLSILPLADLSVTVSTSIAQGSAGESLTFAAGSLSQVSVGEPVSGTDIAAVTTVEAVDNATGVVTLSAATTAAVPINTVITFGDAAAATATIVLIGTATAAGQIPFLLDGNAVNVVVNSGDTASAIASNAVAAINAFTTAGGNPLPHTATAASGTISLTQRNKGPLGNQSTILLSFGGTAAGQGQPGTTNVPGITATITAFSGGEGTPDIANALANIPATSFDFICCPYADGTSLGAISAFLGETAGRWNWSEELFGVAFTAFNGTFAERTTFGAEQNDQFLTAIGASGSPSPDWHWATDYTAASAVSIRSNPSVPIGGLAGGVALNVVAPTIANQDSFPEQNSLLFDGMSTYVANTAGQVAVSRAITTFQQNAAGQPDNAFLSLNVPFQLMAYIRAVRTMITSQFNQSILVANGTPIPAGSPMVTAQTILFSVIALYQQQATQGLVQNAAQFAQQALAQNAGGGLVTMMLPVQLANQLIAVAMDIRFTQP